MNLPRVALATAAATMAAAALAPAAHAWTRFSFATQNGTSEISADSTTPHTRLEVTRAGAVVAQTFTDSLDVVGFRSGDVATLYDGTSVVATGTYDGLPTATNVCTGRTMFSATRGGTAEIVDAGAYRSFAGSFDWIDSVWTADADATVSLARPLAVGDMAYVMTAVTDGVTEIRSSFGAPAASCESTRPERVEPTSPPPVTQITIPASELVPTDKQMLQIVKGSLSASGASLRMHSTRRLARSGSVTLPFAFAEPGRVDLELVAKRKVIGTGAKTSATNGKALVAVKLTTQGRTLLKRSKKLKVTLTATFAPSRAGASPQRASASVTLTASSLTG